MRAIIMFVILTLSCTLFARPNSNNEKKFEVSILGGINTTAFSTLQHAYHIEGAVKAIGDVYIYGSIGYFSSNNPDDYTVNTYEYTYIQENESYKSYSYDVVHTEYQVIPLGIGAMYNIKRDDINPYVYAGINLSYVDALTRKTGKYNINEYNTVDQIPSEYRMKNELPTTSTSAVLGIGVKIPVINALVFNMRYNYRIESDLENSHQILIGFTF